MARGTTKVTKIGNDGAIRAVVAIDFGATRSGFAYAFTSDCRVVGFHEWPDQPAEYPKTSTHLLYGKGRQPQAWGWAAERRVAELAGDGKSQGHEAFANFRRELHRRAKTKRGPAVPRGRRSFAVVDLMADYLGALRELAWNRVRASTAGELGDDEVRWCLTVPAGLTPRNQELMRKAAKKAGLWSGRTRDAERLVLVPEPEAAAIHCQEADRHALAPGSRVLVVDCGGTATVLTAYEAAGSRALRLQALGASRRVEHGARGLDEAFVERYLAKKLGRDFLDTYRRQEPLDFFELMAEWERLKCRFDPDASLGASRVVYSPRLFRLLIRHPEVYDKLRAGGHEDGLWIEPQEMRALFKPAVDAIVEATFEELDEVEPEAIYLVGGFATSPFLVKRFRRELADEVDRVVVPPVPGAAVVEGAVSYGLDPSGVRRRRSRLSYGCVAARTFYAERDPAARRFEYTDLAEPYCRDRFCAFVEAGDVVEVGDCLSWVFVPTTRAQTEMVLDLYASPRRGVRYVNEGGVEKIGDLLVKLPGTDGGSLEREVEISMTFDQTDIRVEATARGRAERRELKLRFSPIFSPEWIGGDS